LAGRTILTSPPRQPPKWRNSEKTPADFVNFGKAKLSPGLLEKKIASRRERGLIARIFARLSARAILRPDLVSHFHMMPLLRYFPQSVQVQAPWSPML